MTQVSLLPGPRTPPPRLRGTPSGSCAQPHLGPFLSMVLPPPPGLAAGAGSPPPAGRTGARWRPLAAWRPPRELKLPGPWSRRHTPAGAGLPHSAPGCPQPPAPRPRRWPLGCQVCTAQVDGDSTPKPPSRTQGRVPREELPLICTGAPCGPVGTPQPRGLPDLAPGIGRMQRQVLCSEGRADPLLPCSSAVPQWASEVLLVAQIQPPLKPRPSPSGRPRLVSGGPHLLSRLQGEMKSQGFLCPRGSHPCTGP